MSDDFLKTPPRRTRDDLSPPRSPAKASNFYGGLFSRSLSSQQPTPGTSPQLSPVPSRQDGSAPGAGLGTLNYAYAFTKSSGASTSTTASTHSRTLTHASTSTAQEDIIRPQPPVLGSPFQPLKSQIPSVPRRLLFPTRGRVPTSNGTNGLNGSSNSSVSALPISPPSAGGPDGASGRTGRHSRWGSASINIEATPASAGSPPVRSSRSSITSRLGRPRSDSAPLDAAMQAVGAMSPRMSLSTSGTTRESDERRWLCDGKKFEVVEEDVQLVGYQIYAVEKWCVQNLSYYITTIKGGQDC